MGSSAIDLILQPADFYRLLSDLHPDELELLLHIPAQELQLLTHCPGIWLSSCQVRHQLGGCLLLLLLLLLHGLSRPCSCSVCTLLGLFHGQILHNWLVHRFQLPCECFPTGCALCLHGRRPCQKLHLRSDQLHVEHSTIAHLIHALRQLGVKGLHDMISKSIVGRHGLRSRGSQEEGLAALPN